MSTAPASLRPSLDPSAVTVLLADADGDLFTPEAPCVRGPRRRDARVRGGARRRPALRRLGSPATFAGERAERVEGLPR